jgi:hypothetical protein
MFNKKIIQYALTFTLWVQTLGNQANAPYSSIAFQRYQECNSKHVGFKDLILNMKYPCKSIKPLLMLVYLMKLDALSISNN